MVLELRMLEFSEDIVCAANDITGLELYTIIVVVNNGLLTSWTEIYCFVRQ